MPDRYPPAPRAAHGALIGSMDAYHAEYARSLRHPEVFWAEQAAKLDWSHPWHTVSAWDFDSVEIGWFLGGKLNVSVNCLDRHIARTPEKTAIIWAGDEPGTYEHLSYAELGRRVGRIANVLQRYGIRKGDRVCLYLPMIPDLAAAMLACARIGAVHSVVFAGFSAEALRDRIVDADCRVVFTANEGRRGGKSIPLKRITDEAIRGLDRVHPVLVSRLTDTSVPMLEGRDVWLHEATARERASCPAAWMDSEDPLFILYTSGSTGRPKGILHTTGGYLTYAAFTHRMVFDLREDDIYFCAADIGWITGHSYIVYGPLANGATTVMFESTPLYPDASRYWQVVDDLGATLFYTAPTALRALAQAGDSWVTRTSRKSLRVLGTVGEPINPEVWRWYHAVIGNGACSVVDTWWQTETGGILIAPLPGATPAKPGSATLPLFGIEPVLVDPDGKILEGNDVSGALCIRGSWPGQARTLYGDHQRFRATYFAAYPGLYVTGDGARRDADGYWWITGRIDDVINVSGHRLGTAEVESALVAHDWVAEAAVVGFPHEIKGTGIYAYVALTEGADRAETEAVLRQQVRDVIGAFAAPEVVHVAAGLPKTRSGKIMRRILRKIAAGEYEGLGDVSTLADPGVVDQLIRDHRERFKKS